MVVAFNSDRYDQGVKRSLHGIVVRWRLVESEVVLWMWLFRLVSSVCYVRVPRHDPVDVEALVGRAAGGADEVSSFVMCVAPQYA